VRRVNISIDDVTPHPRSSIRVVHQCNRILSRIPSAKFTLFVPTAYWRSMPSPPESVCDRPLFLREHPDFCAALSDLPEETYELGFHGHYHGIPGVSNNDELKLLKRPEAAKLFARMLEEVEAVGLHRRFKPIFRPPAWRLSPGAFDAARGVFEILALHPSEVYREIYAGREVDEHWINRIVYQDAAPPIVKFPDEWDSLEIVTHACEWDRNYLSDSLADQIADLMIERSASGVFIGDLLGKV